MLPIINTLRYSNGLKIALHTLFHYSISWKNQKNRCIDFSRKNEKINDTMLHFKPKYEK